MQKTKADTKQLNKNQFVGLNPLEWGGVLDSLFCDYAMQQGYDSPKDLNLSEWSACLINTGKLLDSKGIILKYNNKNNSLSYGLLCYISELYIYYCYKYSKHSTLIDFSYLVNMFTQSLYIIVNNIKVNNYVNTTDVLYLVNDNVFEYIGFNNNDYKLNNNIVSVYSGNVLNNKSDRVVEGLTFPIVDFLQNIKQTSENFIAGRLISQKGSPVGNIVALKHLHGWEETRQNYIENEDNSTKTLDNIAQRMGIETTKDS